jgi:transcriptional regulator with XRE-family HTH domain
MKKNWLEETMEQFKDRLAQAMQIRNISAAELSKKSGLSKAQISQYVNGIYQAKQVALYKLATTLNVSEAWLMGHDVPMQRQTEEDQLHDLIADLSQSELKRISDFMEVAGDLTDDQFEKVMAFAKFVAAEK